MISVVEQSVVTCRRAKRAVLQGFEQEQDGFVDQNMVY